MGRRARRSRRRSSSRLPRHPAELTAPVVERGLVEPAVERLDLEPGDVDEPFPLRLREPPEGERASLRSRLASEGGHVDPVVSLRLLDVLPEAAVAGGGGRGSPGGGGG